MNPIPPTKLNNMKYISIVLFLMTTIFAVNAQDKDYVDHKPEYRKWLDSYIIDKIEYTKTNTIIYFRFICKNDESGGAIFYPPGGASPWYLKGRNVQKDFDILAVKNIRRNGILLTKEVTGDSYHADPAGKTGNTIFSCEVYFPRLPSDLKVADLIEGRGQEYNRRHFNCFNISLKTWEDDLGSEDDSKKKVEEFETKFNTTKTTEDKKPEPKPEPKREPQTKPEPITGDAAPLHSAQDMECQKRLLLDRIQFHDNSTKYKGMINANKTLNLLFDFMREHPNSTIVLHGYSDIFGNKERNEELSEARVIKIQRWLGMVGISLNRIEVEAHGSADPLIPEGDVRNRRVEVEVRCN